MPKRKSYSGRSSGRRTRAPYRRRYKRRYGNRRKYSMAVGTLIADRTKVLMKYADDKSVTVDGFLGQNALFRCNSIFDPDQSGVGHQPMGHDQYANFYQRYVVIGSKITITFKVQEDNTATNALSDQTNVGLTTIRNTSDTITSNTEFMENNRASYGTICPQRPTVKITKKFSPKRFFGVKNVLDEENIAANFGSNPQNEAFWQLRFWPVATGTTRPVNFNVMISYVCVLRERVNIGGS